MKGSMALTTVLGASLVIATSAYAWQGATVQPNTAEAEQALTQLRAAQSADAGNAHSFSDDNPELDHYYAGKAQEASKLIEALEKGRAVATSDVNHALDTSGAKAFGASF